MLKLVPQVRAAIRDGRCKAFSDMRTDNQLKQYFVAITVTFTDEMGKMSETHDLVNAKLIDVYNIFWLYYCMNAASDLSRCIQVPGGD